MAIDSKIISLIIQEEKKKIEESKEYGERAVLYEMPYEGPQELEKEEEPKRGVIVIDI